YTLSGDSITLDAGGMTRMMCDNTAAAAALIQIIPGIATVDLENDTIARLNGSNADQYIVLRKNTGEEIK
ncbi:MAG: META domain-containing protein, partial [Paramuribaculum sp.]|nr:META domain-containing protein [Paramuribaculum sp.]